MTGWRVKPVRLSKFVRPGFLLLVAVGFFGGLLLWQQYMKRFPVELQKMNKLCDKIHLDMPEKDVDTLLSGYETDECTVSDPNFDPRGNRFPRPAARAKNYTKPSAMEGDYFIRIYLDDVGRVVAKGVGTWWK